MLFILCRKYSAGSVFCNPVTVGEGAEKREIAMVYLNRNLWSTYIQPHLQEQNEDEMIYLGKAADMDIIYYGKFDVENFYEKIIRGIKRNDFLSGRSGIRK